MAAKPGDTKKKGKTLYRMSSSGKWFKSSNSKKAQQQRDLNARLNAPIASFQTPQGTIVSPSTERDLAHEAQAATTVQYGPQRQGLANDLTSATNQQAGNVHWYDIYKQKLGAWNQQIQDINAQNVAAAQRLPGMVQGLGQQQQGVVQQQQAQNSAVTGGQVNPQLAQDAGQANSVAQAIGANWAGAAQNMAAARNQYASDVTNVVAPAQERQALDQGQQQITKVKNAQTELAGREGAYNEQYRQGRRTDEQKTLLAQASLGLNTSKAEAAASTAAKNADTAAKKAAASIKAEQKRHSVALKNANTSAARLAETKRHNKTMESLKGTKGGKAGKGPDWVTAQQQNKAGAVAARMKGYAHQLQVGHPPSQKDKDGKDIYPPGVKPGVKYNRQQTAAILRQNPDMDEALLSAVLDAAYVGHLSAYTVRKLIGANYKPSQIASALGVKTRQGMKKVNGNTAAANAAANKVKKVL